ncbi:MAG: hypothetical protein AB1515_00370 [Nitrospirota bacterium]
MKATMTCIARVVAPGIPHRRIFPGGDGTVRFLALVTALLALGLLVASCNEEDSALVAILWGEPVLIGPLGGDAADPQIAIDEDGNAIVVWEQDGEIWANRYEPATGWGAPERIESGSPDARKPQIAILASGEAIAVWDQPTGAYPSIWSNRYVPGGGWGTAELLETDDTWYAIEPDISAAGNSAIAVWFQDTGSPFSIFANRYVAGAGWEGAELIGTDSTGYMFSPQVGMAANGRAIAVWNQDDGPRFNVWANQYVPGVGWGTGAPIEDLPEDALWPAIAADPSGNGLAIWTRQGPPFEVIQNVWTNYYDASMGWGAAHGLTDVFNAFNPRVGADDSGNALAIWNQIGQGDYRIYANRYLGGIGWGASVIINSGHMTSQPQIAVNKAGDALAVWAQDPICCLDTIFAKLAVSRYRAGQRWDRSKLPAPSQGEGVWAPQAALNANGDAIVVWAEWDGTQHYIMASHSE